MSTRLAPEETQDHRVEQAPSTGTGTDVGVGVGVGVEGGTGRIKQRQRRSREAIARHVVEYNASGLRPSDYARQEGIPIATLHAWLKPTRAGNPLASRSMTAPSAAAPAACLSAAAPPGSIFATVQVDEWPNPSNPPLRPLLCIKSPTGYTIEVGPENATTLAAQLIQALLPCLR